MIELRKTEIAVLKQNDPREPQMLGALRRNGVHSYLVDLNDTDLSRVAGRMHIIYVASPNSGAVHTVGKIHELGGKSIVVPGVGFEKALSERFLGFRHTYVVDINLAHQPENLAQIADLMMNGRA